MLTGSSLCIQPTAVTLQEHGAVNWLHVTATIRDTMRSETRQENGISLMLIV
jgi:hypothetical protein